MTTSTQMLSCIFRRTFQSGMFRRSFSNTPRARSAMENIGEKHSPSSLDKKILVWTKQFKSAEEIPEQVTFAKIRKARDLMRIRVNIAMGLATLGGCAAIIQYSKGKWGDGDSLQNRALAWEANIQEKGRAEQREREERAAKE